MDYSSAKFGDFRLRCYGFIVRTDRHTENYTQTEYQTRMIAILTRLPSASVIIINHDRLDTL